MTDGASDDAPAAVDDGPNEAPPRGTLQRDAVDELVRIGGSRAHRVASIGVAIVGLLVAAAIVSGSLSSNQQSDDRYVTAVDRTSTVVQLEVERYTNLVIGTAALFEAGGDVPLEEFEAYIGRRDVAGRFPGTVAIGFAPVVPREQVGPFERQMRLEGLAGYTVHPIGPERELFPITFVSPVEGNEGIVGFNLGADAKGRDAIEEAAASGEPIAGGVLLVASVDGMEQRAFNVYSPAYGAEGPGPLGRDDGLRGVAVGLLRFDEVLSRHFDDDAEVALAIYDLGPASGEPAAPSAGNLVFNSSDELAAPSSGGGTTLELTVLGRHWLLSFEEGPGLPVGEGVPYGAVLFVLAFTAATAVLLHRLGRIPKRALELVEDVTSFVEEREHELQEANDGVVRSNKELERYASIAAHDLQEPLRSLLAYASVLERRYGESIDPEALDYVHRMARAAERMRTLVVDLLAYAKADSAERQIEDVDLNEALRVAIDDLGGAIHESGATIRKGQLPTVPGNRRELIGVFSNLLSNSLKYRSEAAPEVIVAAHERDDEWAVGVQDNGIGIDPAYHDRVFELFRRLEKRASDPGTGLGLAICLRTVQQHGGRMWVESNEGAGATFWFTLPMVAPATEGSAT